MGAVSSRPEEGNPLYLKDQERFSVASLTITNSRNRTLLSISPNAYPSTRYTAKRDSTDESPVEYIQDPESGTVSQPPSFLLRLTNEDDLIFNFTFVQRQANSTPPATTQAIDTAINGLTFLYAPTAKDLDNLVTKELQADPNFHKTNPNVQFIGDYTTGGSPSVQFQWTWRWKPPRATEDRGGGWRNCCSFVEYDHRSHKLTPLANFTFWVQNVQRSLNSPKSTSPRLEIASLNKLRVPSAQSIESRVSDSDGGEPKDLSRESPNIEPIPEDGLGLVPSITASTATTKVDVACQRPGEDVSQVDDGPLFRATMKSMEQRTGSMRARWKKVLRRAEAAHEAQATVNDAMVSLMDALRDASSSNSNAVQPAIEHYFDKIAKEILVWEKQNAYNLQKMIIEPISKLYNVDIKQAENKKRDFEEESKEYYAYVSRYLGQRQDSLKDKKRAETDSKYQKKRRDFELKRFDYSSFMQDLHGGRKDQEVLSNLTKYADAQAKGYLATAGKIEALLPQLEALNFEVKEADKEFQLHRTEREEKRRVLEKSGGYSEPDRGSLSQIPPSTPSQYNGNRQTGTELSRAGSTALRNTVSPGDAARRPSTAAMSTSAPASAVTGPQTSMLSSSPSQSNKFKGFRDLEEKDHSAPATTDSNGLQRGKEGLVWALSRPGSHADPKGLNKQAWHKFWIVLDQGKLSEYTGWKEKLDLHMDPIDLRVASVREARNADRRFCFEIITPTFTRVYQSQSEEDMRSWINSINNALQSAVEGRGMAEAQPRGSSGSINRDIASVLTGKSASTTGHRSGHGSNKTMGRHATVGDRPAYKIEISEGSQKLLQQIRDADAGNKYCADCSSDSKVDWVSINLGIIICIECSGIHRSLGTHISKVRSLTLDPNAFTVDVIEILLTVGNRVSNMIWEARLPDTALKPSPQGTREQRLRFITAKYVDRAYVQPISATLSHYPTADETLLASIKKNDIQNVIYALALKANPNVHDRSRNTHAVFLALAAADPASPSAASSPSPSPGVPRTNTSTTAIRKPFHVAELLMLNGADPPTTLPPIPLSQAAKLYLEAKEEQKSGRKPGAAAVISEFSGGVGHGGDTLTALPTIYTATSGGGVDDRERLRKRVSASGRLVKQQQGQGGGGF